ncbi:MAG: hypothetical protein PHY15_02310 [Eubacteriales bacterium]|nr:hypothetical protein [Eubacteriales bacterium]MDD4474341.1 hypothetical protein [Eubacteriales bacterium]
MRKNKNKYKYKSALPEQVLDEITLYVKAAAEIYGVIAISKLAEIINSQNEYQVTEEDIEFVFNRGEHFFCCNYDKNIIHESLMINDDDEDYYNILTRQEDKPYKVPEKDEFLKYSDNDTIQVPEAFKKLRKYLVAEVEIMRDFAEEICDDLFIGINFNDEVENIIVEFSRRGIYPTDDQMECITKLYFECREKISLWENRGYSYEELNQMGVNIEYDDE